MGVVIRRLSSLPWGDLGGEGKRQKPASNTGGKLLACELVNWLKTNMSGPEMMMMMATAVHNLMRSLVRRSAHCDHVRHISIFVRHQPENVIVTARECKLRQPHE